MLSWRYDQPGLEETFAFDPAGNLMFLPQEASRPALANTAGRDHAHWDQGLAFLEPPAPAVPGPLPPVRHNQLLRYAAQVLSPFPATYYDPATVRAEQDRLDRQAAEQQTEAETLPWLALTQPAAHAQLQ
ncbi:hypothetical protein, partial [Azovibrio restrictus]|uniref:hypothetical protein n=1 Tax=Azovibrio restrictus TaxID=146938 RepID=UPI0012EB22F6